MNSPQTIGYYESFMLYITFATINSLNFTAKIRVLILKNRTNVMFIMTQTEDN